MPLISAKKSKLNSDLSLVVVTLKFQQTHPDDRSTSMKITDCLAYVDDTDDYFGGTFFGNYEIRYKDRHFFIRPADFLEAVDQAIAESEYPNDYHI